MSCKYLFLYYKIILYECEDASDIDRMHCFFLSLFFVIMSFVLGMKLGGGPRGSVPLFLRKKCIKAYFLQFYIWDCTFKNFGLLPLQFNIDFILIAFSLVVKYHKTPNLCKSTFVVSKLCKFAQLLLHKLIFCKFTLLLYIYIYIYIYANGFFRNYLD